MIWRHKHVKRRLNVGLILGETGNDFVVANARFFDPLATGSQYAAGRLNYPIPVMIAAIICYGSCRDVAAANRVLIVKKVNTAHRHSSKQKVALLFVEH